MSFHPVNRKFKKAQKGRVRGTNSRSSLHLGTYGVKSLESFRLTESQLKALVECIMRYIKRIGRLYVNVFCDIPVSAKPAEVRMGKGKGSVDHWVCKVQQGKVLLELSGVSEEVAQRVLRVGCSKLPVKTVFIKLK